MVSFVRRRTTAYTSAFPAGCRDARRRICVWADIGKVTVSTLRGLAARAPYFHDGSAATLMDVVNFYDRRFSIGLSAQDRIDRVNFLNAL
jgi:cytochrome c peroxidase